TPLTLTVTVTDTNGQNAHRDLTLTINDAGSQLAVTTPPTLGVAAGATTTTQLHATGGTTPYTWTLTTPTGNINSSGSGGSASDTASASAGPALKAAATAAAAAATETASPAAAQTTPDWVTLTTDGTLTAAPPADTTPGHYTINITATDNATPPADATTTLDINVGPQNSVFISTNNLPPGSTGTPYNQTLTAEGGTPPYTWTITDGALPDGLALDATTGTITGTPTQATDATFTAHITDQSTPAQTNTAGLEIIVTTPPTITTKTLPDATTDTPYNQTLTAEGGTPPYTWTITNGTLPDGLALDATTGIITGTPTTPGTTTLTLTLTDNTNQTTTHDYTLTTNSPTTPTPTASATSTTSTTTKQVTQTPKGAPNTGTPTPPPTPNPTPNPSPNPAPALPFTTPSVRRKNP
ncbi:cadherin repeat domain-containing protein, partial [Streptomyces sp. NPDC005529]